MTMQSLHSQLWERGEKQTSVLTLVLHVGKRFEDVISDGRLF